MIDNFKYVKLNPSNTQHFWNAGSITVPINKVVKVDTNDEYVSMALEQKLIIEATEEDYKNHQIVVEKQKEIIERKNILNSTKRTKEEKRNEEIKEQQKKEVEKNLKKSDDEIEKELKEIDEKRLPETA